MPSNTIVIPPKTVRKILDQSTLTFIATVKAPLPWDSRLRLWLMLRLLRLVELVSPCGFEIVGGEEGHAE